MSINARDLPPANDDDSHRAYRAEADRRQDGSPPAPELMRAVELVYCSCCGRPIHRGDWYWDVEGNVMRRRCFQGGSADARKR